MFQPIFDFVVYIWDLIVFWCVVHQYDEGIILRLGNYHKKITSKNGFKGTGLHFYLPLGIDSIFEASVVLDTIDLNSQSLTTKDGVGVTIETIVKFNIEEIDKYLLKITDREAAFSDIAASTVNEIITLIDYDSLVDSTSAILLTIEERMQAKIEDYGIRIQSVAFRTMQKCRTIRIINDAAPLIQTA